MFVLLKLTKSEIIFQKDSENMPQMAQEKGKKRTVQLCPLLVLSVYFIFSLHDINLIFKYIKFLVLIITHQVKEKAQLYQVPRHQELSVTYLSASTVKRAVLTSAPGDLSEGNILKSLCISIKK